MESVQLWNHISVLKEFKESWGFNLLFVVLVYFCFGMGEKLASPFSSYAREQIYKNFYIFPEGFCSDCAYYKSIVTTRA